MAVLVIVFLAAWTRLVEKFQAEMIEISIAHAMAPPEFWVIQHEILINFVESFVQKNFLIHINFPVAEVFELEKAFFAAIYGESEG